VAALLDPAALRQRPECLEPFLVELDLDLGRRRPSPP